jgi:hypothetical protein
MMAIKVTALQHYLFKTPGKTRAKDFRCYLVPWLVVLAIIKEGKVEN